MDKNFKNTSTVKKALSLSWPLLITYVLQLTVSLADLKMISVLGASSVAAMGIAQQIILFLFLIFTAISVGASIYVSQYTGKNDVAKMRETIIQTVLLSIIVGFTLSLLGIFSSEPLLGLMNMDTYVTHKADIYLTFTLCFAPILLLNYTLNSIFVATGDSKTPLLIMLLINILNIVFNYFLIFGVWIFPEMNIAGAAFGTGLSRTIGMIISFLVLYRRELLFKVKKVRDIFAKSPYLPRFTVMRRIFTLGFPSSIQDVSWALSMIVLYKILSILQNNTKIISAFTIAFNIEGICIMPGIAFMHAATVLVGQSIGAKLVDEAQKTAWVNTVFGSLSMALIGLPLAVFSDTIMMFFTKDSSVVEIGSTYLILMGSTQLFIGIKFVLIGAIRGAGDTKPPLYVEFVEHWVFRIPLILLFVAVLGFGTTSIWLVMVSSNILSAIAIVVIFKRSRWEKITLLDSD